MFKAISTETTGQFDIIDETDGVVVGSIRKVTEDVVTRRQGNVATGWKKATRWYIQVRRAAWDNAPMVGEMISSSKTRAVEDFAFAVRNWNRK